MNRGSLALVLTALLALLSTPSFTRAGVSARAGVSLAEGEAFERSVRPVLAAKCVSCHGPQQQLGGVRLDRSLDRTTAQKVVAALRYEGPVKMPPSGKLPAGELAALTGWARSGGAFPLTPGHPLGASLTPRPSQARGIKERASAWPYSPVKPPLAPPVDGALTDIDAFLLAKLQAKGLGFSPEADRRTLIRRLSFDLTGLPPAPEQVEAFVGSKDPHAYEKLVDRLLAAPAYGERWGRHWLDVARYADSADARGLGGEGDISEAWRYRDWVIAALNADLPYTDFIRWQLAGDRMGDPVPTGFLAIGNWGNGDADKDKILTDIADEQVDVVSRGFLGLTVACARCHDHKFDPISTRDYYALAGIFFSSHILPRLTPKGQGEVMLRIPLETPAQKAAREQLALVEKQLDETREGARRAVAEALRSHPERLKGTTRWREFLGLDGPRTLGTPLHRIGEVAGVDGVWGELPAVSAIVNTTTQAQKILTFTLPARSVSLHPSPSAGVAALWTAPTSGPVVVEATLSDADPSCGDGFVWELRQSARVLASGTVPNGGSATLPRREVTLQAGETLLLCVLPGGEYSCDTTTVTWKIGASDLTADALQHPGEGAFGPWRFVDLAPVTLAPGVDAILAAWKAGDEARAFALAAALPLEKGPFLPESEDALPADARARLTALDARRRALRASLPTTPRFANGIAEGGVPGSPHEGVHDVKVHQRGRYDTLGELVPRGAPAVLNGGPLPIRSGSGRSELADWIARADNPMTARVMVNRLWQGHFGRGIVGTPSNFGVLGEKPSHPELLDWLAAQLIADGWSLKALHRRIVLSAAYRQSSVSSPLARAKDPDNRLLSRAPRRRLEAEALRDSLLAATGTLDITPGGVAFRDFNTPRRTVYAMTIRSDRTGFGPLFDSADPTNSAEKRTVSTVAPQALFLLNSPFVLAQADALARRLQAHSPSDAARIDFAYRLLYARPPSPRERDLGLRYLTRGGPDAWEAYAQALLCANEFSYVD